MAWTDPIAYNDGDTITARIMALYWRDNLKYLHSPPRAKAIGDTNQSLAGEAGTAGLAEAVVSLNRTLFDTDGMHGKAPVASVPQDALLWANTAGYWLVGAACSFSPFNTACVRISASQQTNGTTTWRTLGRSSSASDSNERNKLCAVGMWKVTSAGGEYFGALARLEGAAGAAVTVIAENKMPHLFAHWRGGD